VLLEEALEVGAESAVEARAPGPTAADDRIANWTWKQLSRLS